MSDKLDYLLINYIHILVLNHINSDFDHDKFLNYMDKVFKILQEEYGLDYKYLHKLIIYNTQYIIENNLFGCLPLVYYFNTDESNIWKSFMMSFINRKKKVHIYPYHLATKCGNIRILEMLVWLYDLFLTTNPSDTHQDESINYDNLTLMNRRGKLLIETAIKYCNHNVENGKECLEFIYKKNKEILRLPNMIDRICKYDDKYGSPLSKLSNDGLCRRNRGNIQIHGDGAEFDTNYSSIALSRSNIDY